MEMDVLIVGAGPVGAALACFLGSHGVKGMVISDAPGVLDTPRANYTNMAAFECLRELGLEDQAREVSHTVREYSPYHRLCHTLAGEEIMRAYTFGNDPHKRGAYHEASPCETACLPQDKLEPLLLQHSSQNGFMTRFGTRLLSFSQDTQSNKVESIVEDVLTGQRLKIVSKYLCGADGANSLVVRELGLPLVQGEGGGLAINLLIEADLSHLMKNSAGLLHYLIRPDRPRPRWGIIGLAHFIKPWTEWVISLVCHPSVASVEDVSEAEMMQRARELIGDDQVEMKLKRVNVWKTEEVYAEQYSRGNVICLGDAVHRHPPFGGLGSNTGIQDAFNLAWKLAYVLSGKGSSTLLSSYDAERQPMGRYVVSRANENGRLNLALYALLGVFGDGERDAYELLSEDSPAGEEHRGAFRRAVQALEAERHGLGAEMNQLYQSSAVYVRDEMSAPPLPMTPHQRATELAESTYPGLRVPHVWLRRPKAGNGGELPLISTRDLCGKGRFTLLTGVGGKDPWIAAARASERATRTEIVVHSIGFGQDYHDPFFGWHSKRGVEEKGAVLVRPDLTVAWRCFALPTAQPDLDVKLIEVMQSVLGVVGDNCQLVPPPSRALLPVPYVITVSG